MCEYRNRRNRKRVLENEKKSESNRNSKIRTDPVLYTSLICWSSYSFTSHSTQKQITSYMLFPCPSISNHSACHKAVLGAGSLAKLCCLVGWSLTSLFSTNTAISETRLSYATSSQTGLVDSMASVCMWHVSTSYFLVPAHLGCPHSSIKGC